MTIYKQASDVISSSQSAVIIFTHGEGLSIDPAGNGETGDWVLDPDNVEEVDRVIIYLRRETETVNRIYLGRYTGIRPSELPRRYILRFASLKEVGTTDANWLAFAGAGQNPVAYLNG